MKLWLIKQRELLFLKIAFWVLYERNVQRSAIISRSDNNSLSGMGEKVESTIERIKANYE